jgi:hypothetical protein
MDHTLSLINLASSCALAALAAWAVLSPSVRDGVLVKLGLILLAMGHGIAALHLAGGIDQADLMGLNRARFVSNLGLLVVVLGYGWRHRRGERLPDLLPGLLHDDRR